MREDQVIISLHVRGNIHFANIRRYIHRRCTLIIKAVVLDLDGTLLNTRKEVSVRSRNAVIQCHQLGMKIIIATARPPRSVRRFVPEMILDRCTVIAYNGALIRDENAAVIEHIGIPTEISAEIIDFCTLEEPDCNISIEVMDHWYANQDINDSSLFNTQHKPEVLAAHQLIELEPTKILITELAAIAELQESFQEKVNIVVTDHGKLVQIMHKNVSKAQALLHISRDYGFDVKDCIVFGDDYNDIDLFNICGYSVAMGNAIDELKEIADEI
ncbi:MAG: hypothetical protein A2189_05945, partial [Paenibacillus sp. RIFOXYA1_FULL_44_5]